MPLSDYFAPSDIHLDLKARDRRELFPELASFLHLDPSTAETICRLLEQRELTGSTGIVRGIAVPHCRTALVPRLRAIYARKAAGIAFDAIDGNPVEHFFVLLAPPIEVANEYLPVLGRIARLAKEADVSVRLHAVATPEDFLRVLAEKGV